MQESATNMKTTHCIATYQSLADDQNLRNIRPIYQRAYRARPIFAALLFGAGLTLAFGSAPAKPAGAKQTAVRSTDKPKDDRRIYNPQSGNFDEAPPFGPRSNN
jgi:hypothetical protein